MKFNDEKSFAATLKKIFYKSGGKRTDLALNSTLDVFKAASVRSGSKVGFLIHSVFLIRTSNFGAEAERKSYCFCQFESEMFLRCS